MGKQESDVRQTPKKIWFCRPRGSPIFLALDTHCLAILENLHMTGTLTLLHFSLGRGGTWGLE